MSESTTMETKTVETYSKVTMPEGCHVQPINAVKWVRRESLSANDYNPNHVAPVELDLLEISILEDGWTQPIVAGIDNVIVDGFHRWTVSDRPKLRALTDGWVPVVFVSKERAERMLATIRHNRARGVHGIRPMCAIVRELQREGLTEKELCDRLGMEREEVERLSDLAGSPEQVARKRETFNSGWVPDPESGKK